MLRVRCHGNGRNVTSVPDSDLVTRDTRSLGPDERATLAAVGVDLWRHPVRLLTRWNWKSAVISAVIRAAIFFAANLPYGRAAAWAAFSTEIWFRLATSGFYGGLTQELGRVEPEWRGMLAATIALPMISHTLELSVHLVRGTPALLPSILASMAFTVLSTSFNVFAMRRGALVTGSGSQPLHRDLMRMPASMARFGSAPLVAIWRLVAARPRAVAPRVPRSSIARRSSWSGGQRSVRP